MVCNLFKLFYSFFFHSDLFLDIQTEQYLEELSDKVPEFDAQTQTDHIMDQPPIPMYVPQEEGIHVGTQVEDDLFDFDYEWYV